MPQYQQSHRLPLRELRAASAIIKCQTPEMGGHVWSCPAGHFSQTLYNSCRHRSCPRCADGPRQRWLQSQLQRLLPCDHFHAVFTLPHDFLALWAHNRQRMASLLFDCARQSLLQLCADERFLGATPGILMSMHTWGRTLSQHPHVHCLITGGGLDSAGQWRACKQHYLVPVKALCALFRGKLLHHLQADLAAKRLVVPAGSDAQHWHNSIKAQYKKHWNVQLAEPYTHGRGVALYLARYVKGDPLPAGRQIELQGERVRFGYTDHRDHQAKTLELSANEFIARVLWHAPPARQHMVRHCGLYASAAHRQHQQSMQRLCPRAMPATAPTLASHAVLDKPSCPTCRLPLQRSTSLLPLHSFGEIYKVKPQRASEGLGPTRRSSGHPTASTAERPRRPSLVRRMPLN
jgi:hypothetical protein